MSIQAKVCVQAVKAPRPNPIAVATIKVPLAAKVPAIMVRRPTVSNSDPSRSGPRKLLAASASR